MRSTGFDTVKACRIDGGKNEVGIGIRIAGAKLETRCIRCIEIADKTGENRTVAGWNFRRASKGGNDADRSLKTGLQAIE